MRVAKNVTGEDPKLTEHVEQIAYVMNGNLEFGDPASGPSNIDGAWVKVTSPVGPDTEFIITHALGRVPTGYFVVSRDKAGIVYNGVTQWNTTQLSLKCNLASVALVVFVI